MFLKRIIVFGFMMGMFLLYAAPARKMSTTRVGQLEAEYRKAAPARKDAILKELKAAGFERVAEQLTQRYVPVKKQEQEVAPQQEPQKPTQAATKVQPVQQPIEQASVQPTLPQQVQKTEQTEQQRIAQAKEHAEKIKQYNTQFQQLEKTVRDIVTVAKSVQDFDALSKQIDDLASLKAQLQTDSGDTELLRKLLQDRKQMFIKKQQDESNALNKSVQGVINQADLADTLDKVNAAIKGIQAEKLRLGVYALEQREKDTMIALLNDTETALQKKKNKLLQQQTEQEQKERAEQDRIAKEKAAKEAASKAEQEAKQKQQELEELQKKIAALVNEVESTIKNAQAANTLDDAAEQMRNVMDALKFVEDSQILPDSQKKQLLQSLRSVLSLVREKHEQFIKDKSTQNTAKKMQSIRQRAQQVNTEGQIRALIDEINTLQTKLGASDSNAVKELDVIKQMLNNKMKTSQVTKKQLEENRKKLQEAVQFLVDGAAKVKTPEEARIMQGTIMTAIDNAIAKFEVAENDKKTAIQELNNQIAILERKIKSMEQKESMQAEAQKQQQAEAKSHEVEKKEQENKVATQKTIDARDEQIRGEITKQQAQGMLEDIDLQLLTLNAVNLAKADKEQFIKKLEEQKLVVMGILKN